MARESLTGSRIRERRQIAGLRQAELARQVGISASYINLIEHNRRRIGGKLLLDIARVLKVDPTLLTEGAEAALVAALREAAADSGVVAAEAEQADELAGRFPGWAEVLSTQHQRILSLEQAVEMLSDRFNRDPYLAESMHEVLSTATAIRSTAAILAETNDLTAEWRDRFHKNIDQDSRRLADSSKALVAYLDANRLTEDQGTVPQEEAEAYIAARQTHFPALETGSGDVEALIADAPDLSGSAAQQIVRNILRRYAQDAEAIPLAQLRAGLKELGMNPLALAQRFNVSLTTVLRRLAVMPLEDVGTPIGLVICDASGSILFRKAIEGFALPRFGESCPLWPLYGALSRPMTPLRRKVAQPGRDDAEFDCIAVCEPVGQTGFDEEPVYRSTMMIMPVPTSEGAAVPAAPVGVSCRICPRTDCRARREPSILGEGF